MQHLAQPFVGHAGAQRRRHIGMLGQQMVDLERRDLDAAARDDVLGAADELDQAMRIHPREVAALEIAVVERGRGQLRIVEIADEAERRADLQLAGGRDAEVDPLGRAADAAEALRLIGRAEAEVAGAGFGQAVEIVERGRRETPDSVRELCATSLRRRS